MTLKHSTQIEWQKEFYGMGDVLSIIEKAEDLTQLRQIKKMGSFSSILKMIPGANKLGDIKVDDNEFVKIEAMICSMTKKERRHPKILNASRRARIAKRFWYNSTRYKQIHEIFRNDTKHDETNEEQKRWNRKSTKRHEFRQYRFKEPKNIVINVKKYMC